jgi:hypothetical protein
VQGGRRAKLLQNALQPVQGVTRDGQGEVVVRKQIRDVRVRARDRAVRGGRQKVRRVAGKQRRRGVAEAENRRNAAREGGKGRRR